MHLTFSRGTCSCNHHIFKQVSLNEFTREHFCREIKNPAVPARKTTPPVSRSLIKLDEFTPGMSQGSHGGCCIGGSLSVRLKICVCVFVCLRAGRGCGWRGKLHHPLLRADGLGGVSHPNRDSGDLLPGGTVALQGGRQTAQAGRLRARLLHHVGLSHQGLLSGRQPGRAEGKVPEPC